MPGGVRRPSRANALLDQSAPHADRAREGQICPGRADGDDRRALVQQEYECDHMPGPLRPTEEIRIANRATYWPVAPLDLVVGAPLVARVLLGATPVGRVMQGVLLGAYLGCALRDWHDRRGIRKIAFLEEFGADGRRLVTMPPEVREAEVRLLAEPPERRAHPRSASRAAELAVEVDRHLTGYIAGITGQRVCTSTAVRGFTAARLAFPFARGPATSSRGTSRSSRTPARSRRTSSRHEFSHRKGYWKELHAQALAYLALVTSVEPVLVQSARFERLYRHLRVLAGRDRARYRARGSARPAAPRCGAPSSSRAARAPGRALARRAGCGSSTTRACG